MRFVKEYSNKRRTDKMRAKLTEITLITPTTIHTKKTKHQNKRRTDKTRAKLTEITLITPTTIHTKKTKHQNKV